MFYLTELYLIVIQVFLASKDANSYLMKAREDNAMTSTYIKRWHRDGAALDILSTVPLAMLNGGSWWYVALVSLLIRLAIFDLVFNHLAGLNIHYLGSTAAVDKFFVRQFGINGAVKKSLFFAAMLVVLTAAKAIF